MFGVTALELAEEIEWAYSYFKMAEERYYSHLRKVENADEAYIRDCIKTDGSVGKRYANLWDEWTAAKFKMGELTGCSNW